MTATDTRRPTQDQLLEWMQSLSNWGRWGEDDQKGTLNLITPEKTKRALGLVQEGVSVSCARDVPWTAAVDTPRPPVHFMLGGGDKYRPGEGPDRQAVSDYIGMVFHGHTVTHVDSLCHFMWDGKMYNGASSMLIDSREGAQSHDVTAAKLGILTRGVLVDAARLRGVEVIERGDGVGLDDVERAERECGFKIEEGDVLLMRTGQLGYREKVGPIDPVAVGSAGPKPELLPLFKERGIAVMGTDTGNDVAPSGYERFSNPVHQVGIVALGLWILDNAWLDDLSEACAARNRWEFLISINPLRMPTVTGSPVNPIAVF
ncbi:MAG TPA: cyclase family protein [Chloroflexota bacterium]|nr:cyclase family protein [Chloroflexota bacterium]